MLEQHFTAVAARGGAGFNYSIIQLTSLGQYFPTKGSDPSKGLPDHSEGLCND